MPSSRSNVPFGRRIDRIILVPLTNSLYAPGKLSDPTNVIVDIGTGYYVQKVIPSSNITPPFYLHTYLSTSLNTTPATFNSLVQSRVEAEKHYTAKIEQVKSNLDPLQETIQKKQENMGYLINVMQAKLQAQTQGGDGDAGKEAS